MQSRLAVVDFAEAAAAKARMGMQLQKVYCRLANVAKVFHRKGEAPVTAVEDVSFNLMQGELVSLLGPSGCGKTTVMRILAGLTDASSGTVEICDRPVRGPQRDFGVVFQSPTLMPWRSVIENILFPMEVLGRKDLVARSHAHELLRLVGLDGFADARPGQLSGGMQQRVALCRALIHQPALLLMDEPFGALDELTRMEMNDLLLEVRRVTKPAALFVTHSIAESIYLSDRVLVFSKRPARIVLDIKVDFPYPRTAKLRYTEEFRRLEEAAGAALGITR
ncbi:MAG TPA: ABC transporter ATP-binding protein [Rhizomicrobium sp.]|nr:ABC transporter ATP-binding protein [Rhizomicrobium sp.]